MICNNCKSENNYSLWIRDDKILCSNCNDSDDLYYEMIDVDNIYYNESSEGEYDITGLIFILKEQP